MKNFLTQWELKKKINDCWERDTKVKVVNEKTLDLKGVLGGKPTPQLEP